MKWVLFLSCLQAYAYTAPFVTCELYGQLGNQMFQVAATLAYAWDYNAIPIFPELNRLDHRIAYNRDRLFFRLDPSPIPIPITKVFAESEWSSPNRIPFYADNLRLKGYFISWAHFHHHRDRLLQVLAPSEALLAKLKAKYRNLIAHPNTVSIHVRTFNEEQHRHGLHHFLGMGFYQKAIDLFPSDTIFVVFSDRINWCKMHFLPLGKHFVFIEENDAIEDLFLMAMMKHHIIANSTFSWWGAYLNQNPDKKIVAPLSWHHPNYGTFPPPQPNQIYFDDWITVSPDYSESYPQDIAKYDKRSQSIDAN